MQPCISDIRIVNYLRLRQSRQKQAGEFGSPMGDVGDLGAEQLRRRPRLGGFKSAQDQIRIPDTEASVKVFGSCPAGRCLGDSLSYYVHPPPLPPSPTWRTPRVRAQDVVFCFV